MQDKQKLFVKQKAGALSIKRTLALSVLTDTDYSILISFDGSMFHVFIGGIEKITMPKIADPAGSMKLRVKTGTDVAVTGRFGQVAVY